MRFFVCPTNGPDAFMPKVVRRGGFTMDNFFKGNVLHTYSQRAGSIYVALWELGGFVSSAEGVMFGAREIGSYKYEGAL